MHASIRASVIRFKNSLRILFSRSEQGRGVDRIRRAGLTGITRMFLNGILIASGLISIPLTIGYLGKERYGIWLTINSLLQWLHMSNSGLIGNALVNKLSEANGKDDKNLAQELVSTAFWSLSGITIILLFIFAGCFQFINWASVFNVSKLVSIGEIQLSVILAFVGFVAIFPTSVADSVYQGYQEGFIGDLWGILSSVVSLITLIIVVQFEGGLPFLILSLFGVKLLFSFLNTIYLFFIRHPWLKPSPRTVTKKSFFKLIDLGWKYLLFQLSSVGVYQSQPIILAQILGPSSVGIFNVAYRVMTLPMIVINTFLWPFVPFYGEAKTRDDWRWVWRNLRRTFLLATFGSVVMVFPLVFFLKTIMFYLFEEDVTPSDSLIIVFAVYVIGMCIMTPFSVVLYGLERIGVQAIITALRAFLSIVLGVMLTQSYGIVGMALAMTIAFILVNPVGETLAVRSAFKSSVN